MMHIKNLILFVIVTFVIYTMLFSALVEFRFIPGKKTLQILIFIIGTLVAGEALALAIGMHVPLHPLSKWISVKNELILFFDLALGIVILILTFKKNDLFLSKIMSLILVFLLLSHLIREWEYMSGRSNCFCSNQPLFIMNTIKTIGVLILLSILTSYISVAPFMSSANLSTTVFKYRVTATNISYKNLMSEDLLSTLKDYDTGIILAVREETLNDDLDFLLERYEQQGIDISLAPLLSEKNGVYLNMKNSELYLDLIKKVFAWSEQHNHKISEIVADIEPSYIPATKPGGYFDFARFYKDMNKKEFERAIPIFQQIVAEIKIHGTKATCCTAWFVILDESAGATAWQNFFGGPSVALEWDSVIFMMYSDWYIASGRFVGINTANVDSLIYRYCLDIQKLWGDKANVILGSTLGEEGINPVYQKATEIQGAVAAAKAAGISSISLYDLQGLIDSGEMRPWFIALSETAPASPSTGVLLSHVYKELFKFFSLLLQLFH